MTELTAGTAAAGMEDDAHRPGWIRVQFVTWFAVLGGTLLAGLAVMAPALVGVAVAQPDLRSGWAAPYVSDSGGAVLANVAIVLLLIWAMTLVARPMLTAWVADVRPAWTWVALPLAIGLGLAAVSPVVTQAAGLAIAGVLLRWTAYERDGSARPEPFTALWASRWRWFAGVTLPAVLVASATAYAIYHPLHASWPSGPEGTEFGAAVKSVRTDLVVPGPTLDNDGGRPLRVLAVEPGVEHGYALHLSGMKMDNMGVYQRQEDMYRPFRPFVIGAHDEHHGLQMIVSRAGCRPGTSGRIESVRVRYLLGGEHTMTLRLEHPLTLFC